MISLLHKRELHEISNQQLKAYSFISKIFRNLLSMQELSQMAKFTILLDQVNELTLQVDLIIF